MAAACAALALAGVRGDAGHPIHARWPLRTPGFALIQNYRAEVAYQPTDDITDSIREMLRENPNIQAIKAEALKNGLTSLYEYGTQLVIGGETSMQELLRVSK